ncbi:MAG: hypothetical protein OEM22_08655 [Acidimicrobiia bacterium]|nr:hypothetical protein [Acidimicrobiia bacterium]MDH3469781.1 hypothetical protein [Acidimicrobiia bacterium]
MSLRNGLFAAIVAIMLVGSSVLSAWVLVTSGLLGTDGTNLSGPLAAAAPADIAQLESAEGIRISGEFQISQPRDPFRPLITPDSPVIGQPGTGDGNGDGNGDDDGNGNGDGFTPSGVVVALVDIRDVGGVLRATVTVNGTSFDVGVGDTFADVYKVVSLSEESGVFMFGDNAFQLNVGQQILK